MKLLKCMAIKLTSNEIAQRVLEKAVSSVQLLSGVGAGGGVRSSGEAALFHRLKAARGGNGFCIFDVGANRGQFLDLAISELEPHPFTVHSFEPSAATFRMLAESRSPDPRVVLNPFGLGRTRGEATLWYDRPGSGLASLSKRRLDHFGTTFDHSERVTIETLDDYCETRGIKHIDLLKVDVEGHELDVFAGGQRMMSGAISMVSFEFGGCNIDTRTYFQDFFHFFRKFQMRLYRITPSGFLFPLPKYAEHFEQFRTTNFVAISDS